MAVAFPKVTVPGPETLDQVVFAVLLSSVTVPSRFALAGSFTGAAAPAFTVGGEFAGAGAEATVNVEVIALSASFDSAMVPSGSRTAFRVWLPSVAVQCQSGELSVIA